MGDLRTALLELVALVTAFGEVERATGHPDGRPETDTTHTVMLALVGVVVAHRLGMDPARVALLALVHDLPEAICGDTPTLHPMTPEERQRKNLVERDAADRIAALFPVLGDLLRAYERRDAPEARLVHALDKLLPKLMAIRDDGRAARRWGATLEGLRATHARQAPIYASWPELADLARWAVAQVEAMFTEAP